MPFLDLVNHIKPITHYDIKILLCGDVNVGKSSLIIQYLQNHFVEHYDPTIDDSYRKQLIIDQQLLDLEIYDLSGNYSYQYNKDSLIDTSDGFIIVYSLSNYHSLERARLYINEITIKRGNYIPIILVGNKSDLYNNITPSQISSFLSLFTYSNIKSIQLSAKDNHSVNLLFLDIIKNIVAYKSSRSGKIKKISKLSSCHIS